MKYRIFRTEEFEEWYKEETARSRVQIDSRISNIKNDGHFGKVRYLEDDVWELKWDNGRRIYYSFLKEENILLILGGNKNGQSKDIRKAKKINNTYTKIET
jgi:putative addiction module killer protein